MRIEVRLFAVAKELAGGPTVGVELPEPASVRSLRSALGDRFPALKPLLRGMRLAVGHEYVGDDTTLGPGDEVALIPPVSGG